MVGAAAEQVPQVRLGEPQVELAGVAAREHQQVVGDPGEPVGFLGGGVHRGGEFRGAASRPRGQLEFPAQHSERRTQLVAGVVDERALASSVRRSRLSRSFMVPARAATSSLVRGTCRTAGGVIAHRDRRA